MDFYLASHDEILHELGHRLRTQRLAQNLPQKELAAMAGISVGALKTLERSGASSLETFVRVSQALGLADTLQTLFVPPRQSIAQMEQLERAHNARRARRKRA